MSMTKKDFEVVAEAVRTMKLLPIMKPVVAEGLADVFKAQYPNFNYDVFIRACTKSD